MLFQDIALTAMDVEKYAIRGDHRVDDMDAAKRDLQTPFRKYTATEGGKSKKGGPGKGEGEEEVSQLPRWRCS